MRAHATLIIFALLLGASAVVLLCGVVYQIIGTLRDRGRFLPPGRLVRFHKRSMHIHVTGEGIPTVVFESGMGASCLSWTQVQREVARFSCAVSYDRAGQGWSDPTSEPRTARQIAKELRALLHAASVPGPYILVGHSFGGYVVRAFADLYRHDVVGMVLVDSIHPAEWMNPTAEQRKVIHAGMRYAWIAAWLARLGFIRFCLARVARGSPRLAWAAATAFGTSAASALQRIAGEIQKLPATVLPNVRAFWSQPKSFLSLAQYVAGLPASAMQTAALPPLGDLPLVVLSGDHHVPPYTDWQRDLAQLSSQARQLVVPDSGHWIHLDRPEIATQAIREVLAAARSAMLSEPCSPKSAMHSLVHSTNKPSL